MISHHLKVSIFQVVVVVVVVVASKQSITIHRHYHQLTQKHLQLDYDDSLTHHPPMPQSSI